MKPFTTIFKRLPTLLLAAVVFSSCAKEAVMDVPDNDKKVTFFIELPGPTRVETRSVGSIEENHIDNVLLLAFDKTTGNLSRKIPVPSSSLTYAPGGTNGNRWQFTVDIVPGNYDLMALANTSLFASELAAISPSAFPVPTKESVAELLLHDSSDKWGFTGGTVNPIPMWGELGYDTSNPPGTAEFKLTRMLARINVNLAGTVTNFRLTSIRYFNRSTKGYLVPDPANYTTSGDGTVTVTAPTSYGNNMGMEARSLLYDGNDITNNRSCSDIIYVFEAATKGIFSFTDNAWKENPCLVVGGQWYDGENWGAETYYRVDFIRDGVEPWLSLLRNHSYNVTINRVEGPGYGDLVMALDLAPMNMDASTYEVNESEMNFVSVDGPYYLAISEEQILMENIPNNYTATLTIKTNHPYGWQAEFFNDPQCTSPMTDNWVSLDQKESNLPTPEEGTPLLVTLADRTAGYRYIRFTAGRMSVVVTVRRYYIID